MPGSIPEATLCEVKRDQVQMQWGQQSLWPPAVEPRQSCSAWEESTRYISWQYNPAGFQQLQGQDVMKTLWEAKPNVTAIAQGKALREGHASSVKTFFADADLDS